MISYWVSRDSTSTRSDEYILWRRVNDAPVQVIARGLQIPVGQPFFTYWRANATGQLTTIPKTQLPVYWNSTSGLADSIRSVDLTVRGVFRDRNSMPGARCVPGHATRGAATAGGEGGVAATKRSRAATAFGSAGCWSMCQPSLTRKLSGKCSDSLGIRDIVFILKYRKYRIKGILTPVYTTSPSDHPPNLAR